MKKVLCVFLVSVMMLCTFAPVGAVSEDNVSYDGYPLVVVRGIDFGGLYLEDGSPAIRVNLSDIVSFIKNYFIELVIERNENAFIDSSLNMVSDIFEPISMDKEGKSIYDICYEKYEKSMAHYPEKVAEMRDNGEAGIVKTAIDSIGAENVYYFTYDWRRSAEELGSDLDAFIDDVMTDTHKDKVNIVAVSMGGMVTTSYLYYHGSDSINNLVYISSAHNGTYGPGDAFNGDIYFDGDVIYSRIRKSFSGGIIGCLFLDIAKKIGAFDALTIVANKIVEMNPQAFDNDVLRNGLGTLLGLWALCPDEKLRSGVDFLFGGYEDEYPVIIEKLRETEEFLFATEEAIDGAINNGVNVTFISNYNTPLAPYFKHSYMQGDGVLETRLTSNFALVADYGETLTEEQLADAEAEYVSPDRIIDATSALYRDVTWFVKDAAHVAAEYQSDYADFVMWLAMSDRQLTINSDADYPQFMSLNGEKKLIITE